LLSIAQQEASANTANRNDGNRAIAFRVFYCGQRNPTKDDGMPGGGFQDHLGETCDANACPEDFTSRAIRAFHSIEPLRNTRNSKKAVRGITHSMAGDITG
jgi:hypothetical protein